MSTSVPEPPLVWTTCVGSLSKARSLIGQLAASTGYASWYVGCTRAAHMRSPRRVLLPTLVLTACADPPADEPAEPIARPAAVVEATLQHPSAQTLDQLAKDVAPLELVFSHSVVAPAGSAMLPAGTELDKYTLALDGVPVE